jgi:hypothetical protein
MAVPTSVVFGKVHCATIIRLTKKEEGVLLKEHKGASYFRAAKNKERFGFPKF